KLPAAIAEECPNVRIPRVTALTVDPSDHRNVWAGIEVDGVLHSSDGGDSWRRVTSGINDPDIHDIGVFVNGGTTVLTTTPREIFASHDRGDSWQGLRGGGACPHPHLPPPGSASSSTCAIAAAWCRRRTIRKRCSSRPGTARSAPPGRSSARRTAARAG